jgi:glucose/arabinose dehydrogenase
MKIIYVFLFCASIVLACSSSKNNPSSTASSNATSMPENANFHKYCEGCHGKNMEGFRRSQWKHGSSDSQIFASIKNGIENSGMPSYKNTFSDSEIKSIVSYIKAEISKSPTIEINKNNGLYSSENFTLKVDTLTDQVDVPWGIETLPDGSMLITDRDGDFYHRYVDGKLVKIQGTPQVHSKGQGGLLDVIKHPDYKENKWVYLSYSKTVLEDGKEKSTTAISRVKIENDIIILKEEIFVAKPYFTTNHHYGCRIIFDKDNFMFVSVGERGKEFENPQSLSSQCGKIHRLHDDGSIPKDNPYINDKSVSPSIYAYGIRNPQGMAIHPITGDIWEHEHGPMGGDEINIIKPKNNYGWPVTTYGINYNGTKITDLTSKEGITDPIHYWLPSIAPCGASFVTSDLYGKWKGDFMVPSLRFNYLARCIIKDGKVEREEKLLQGIGRMRTIKMGDDGFLYIGVENPGYVYKIRPLW